MWIRTIFDRVRIDRKPFTFVSRKQRGFAQSIITNDRRVQQRTQLKTATNVDVHQGIYHSQCTHRLTGTMAVLDRNAHNLRKIMHNQTDDKTHTRIKHRCVHCVRNWGRVANELERKQCKQQYINMPIENTCIYVRPIGDCVLITMIVVYCGGMAVENKKSFRHVRTW